MTRLVSLPRYALVYILTTIGVAILLGALVRFAGIDISSSGNYVVPPMIAAMVEGQRRATAGAQPYTSREAWIAACLMTLVAMAIDLVPIFFVVVLVDWMGFPMFSAFDLWIYTLGDAWIFFLGFVALVTLGCNRYFLTMGYKNQRKYLEKKAQE